MVPPSARVLEEHEFERWLFDGEVGVARLDLGRFGLEELRVELDRFIETRNVQRELKSRHGYSYRLTCTSI